MCWRGYFLYVSLLCLPSALLEKYQHRNKNNTLTVYHVKQEELSGNKENVGFLFSDSSSQSFLLLRGGHVSIVFLPSTIICVLCFFLLLLGGKSIPKTDWGRGDWSAGQIIALYKVEVDEELNGGPMDELPWSFILLSIVSDLLFSFYLTMIMLHEDVIGKSDQHSTDRSDDYTGISSIWRLLIM